MCSNRWAKPVRPAASLAGPTWYQRFTATIGRPRFGLRTTSSPFGSVYFSSWMRGISTGLVCADEVITPATASSATSRWRTERLFIMWFAHGRPQGGPDIAARRRPLFTAARRPLQIVTRRLLPERLGGVPLVLRERPGGVPLECCRDSPRDTSRQQIDTAAMARQSSRDEQGPAPCAGDRRAERP